MLLSNGVYPFKDAPDRWSVWRQGKWVPEKKDLQLKGGSTKRGDQTKK